MVPCVRFGPTDLSPLSIFGLEIATAPARGHDDLRLLLTLISRSWLTSIVVLLLGLVPLLAEAQGTGKGYGAKLARPGGNITGVFFQQRELTASVARDPQSRGIPQGVHGGRQGAC